MDIQIAMQSKINFRDYANLQNITLVVGGFGILERE